MGPRLRDVARGGAAVADEGEAGQGEEQKGEQKGDGGGKWVL